MSSPWAVHSSESRGRRYAELARTLTDPFELDRHRVLHSAAFRRLEYKTQVFVIHTDDHYRTRLTHTLEVAAIARRLAHELQTHETLAETIALAHDLGHAPFGHAGEKTLSRLMARHGGFEHNSQSLRVVDFLEHPYPSFRGLNLTFETREGLVKHFTTYDHPTEAHFPQEVREEFSGSGRWPSLEGQIACLADRLAYDGHDLEDAIGAGLITEHELEEVELWKAAASPIRQAFPDATLAAVRRPILDRMLDAMISDAVSCTRTNLARLQPRSVDDIRNAAGPAFGVSDTFSRQLAQLENWVFEKVYRHPVVARMDADARSAIERLFHAYCDDPRWMPERFSLRIPDQGLHRVVCDYIAGMTDRFCQNEFKRLFESQGG